MNKPRRKPSDAMELEPDISTFIAEGVRAKKAAVEVVSPEKKTASRATHSHPDGYVDESPKEPVRNRKTKAQRLRAMTNDNSWNQATLSKATIQKTIRFNPQLIARWERHTEELRRNGEPLFSFQQVQNEALLLWLESKNS